MGLNDEQEKLKQAEEWLRTLRVPDMRVKAAWEYVTFVFAHSEDPELRKQAKDIITLVTGKDCWN